MRDLEHVLKPLSRRGFIGRSALFTGAAVTAGLAGGFAYLRRSPVDDAEPVEGLRNLSQAQAQLVIRTAAMDQFNGVAPVALPLALTVDQLIDGLPASVRDQLLVGLSLFDNAAVLTGGHAKRFVDLPTPAAERYIDAWMNSQFATQRAIASALLRLVKSAYWSLPQTWPSVGYIGPVTRPRGIESLGNTPLPEGV